MYSAFVHMYSTFVHIYSTFVHMFSTFAFVMHNMLALNSLVYKYDVNLPLKQKLDFKQRHDCPRADQPDS